MGVLAAACQHASLERVGSARRSAIPVAALDKRGFWLHGGVMAFAIDTAATIADLEAAGVEAAHAKAIVHAINGAAGDPVGKEDFKELRGEFRELRGEFRELRGDFKDLRDEFNGLRDEFNGLRDEFNGLRDEFNGLRAEVKVEIDGLRAEFNGLRNEFNGLRAEVKADIKELRDECHAVFATKADLAALKSALTIRIVAAQVATAMLLFAMLKVFV